MQFHPTLCKATPFDGIFDVSINWQKTVKKNLKINLFIYLHIEKSVDPYSKRFPTFPLTFLLNRGACSNSIYIFSVFRLSVKHEKLNKNTFQSMWSSDLCYLNSFCRSIIYCQWKYLYTVFNKGVQLQTINYQHIQYTKYHKVSIYFSQFLVKLGSF